MINKIKKILLIAMLPLVLSGCWDYEDIDHRDITLSIGVEEEDGRIAFSGEIAKLISESNKSGSTATVTDVYHYTSVGKNFEEARNDFDYKTPLADFSGAIRSVVLSKEYAKEKGIESYINRLSFIPGFRSSVLIAISEESTEELFEKKVVNDISVGYAIEDTLLHLEKEGAAIYTTAQELRYDIAFKEIGYAIPYITKEEDTIKYLGLAVMKNSKLIGIIDVADSNGFLYIAVKNATSTKIIPNPKNQANQLSIKTMLEKRKISTDYNDGKVFINIKLDLKSQIQYEYIKEPISQETIKELENIIANMIKEEVVSSIKSSQREFECDIFGFGRYFKAENPQIWKSINWVEKYPDARINVEVKSRIVNYNMLNINFKENYKGGTQ